MQKFDLIVSWPANCDYPLWRLFIHENRHRFNKVIIVFTAAPGQFDYCNFVIQSMAKDNIDYTVSPTPIGDQDWRDVAVKAGLMFSDSDWVWFTEQDFYPTSEGFFDDVDAHMNEGREVIAAYQGDRMHPCSIFIKRQLLNELDLDFGIVPNKLDHFGKIQQQIDAMVGFDVGVIDPRTYHHFNGLSHNWRLINDGQPAVYKADDFIEYIKSSIKVPVPIHAFYKAVAQRAIDAHDAIIKTRTKTE